MSKRNLPIYEWKTKFPHRQMIKTHRIYNSTQEQSCMTLYSHYGKRQSLEIVEENFTQALYESASSTTADD